VEADVQEGGGGGVGQGWPAGVAAAAGAREGVHGPEGERRNGGGGSALVARTGTGEERGKARARRGLVATQQGHRRGERQQGHGGRHPRLGVRAGDRAAAG
jgi:hypothetical protein